MTVHTSQGIIQKTISFRQVNCTEEYQGSVRDPATVTVNVKLSNYRCQHPASDLCARGEMMVHDTRQFISTHLTVKKSRHCGNAHIVNK
jgi:hypothetical protein